MSAPYRPDAIVTYLDANMATFAHVAETLGLPFHTPATAVALTDKAEQRRVLRRAGLEVPGLRRLPAGSVGADLRRLKPRWVASGSKPRSAQGSRYTFFVETRSSTWRNSSATWEPNGPTWSSSRISTTIPRARGESYADYVSVESIVARGVISHLALTGRFPLAENFRETGFFIPAALSERDEAAVLRSRRRGHRGAGRDHGLLHTEIKFTPEGPRVIEVNGRVGGGVPEMLDRAAGVALVEMTLRWRWARSCVSRARSPPSASGFDSFCSHPRSRRRSPRSTASTQSANIRAWTPSPCTRARRRPRLERRFAKSHHGRRRIRRRLRRTARRGSTAPRRSDRHVRQREPRRVTLRLVKPPASA